MPGDAYQVAIFSPKPKHSSQNYVDNCITVASFSQSREVFGIIIRDFCLFCDLLKSLPAVFLSVTTLDTPFKEKDLLITVLHSVMVNESCFSSSM